jgi:hypothetical protein
MNFKKQSLCVKNKILLMDKFCKKCGRVKKNPKATHCSDECLLDEIKKSKSLNTTSKGVETWDEDADPWT